MKKILSYLFIAGASYMGYSQCTVPFVAPWLDGFEAFTSNANINNQNCWRDNGSGPNWQTRNAPTTSFATGPSGAFAGSRYAYLETSTGVGTDSLTTPLVDISGLANPALSFYYHMYGAAMGTLSVDVYDGTSWSPVLWTLSGQQQTSEAAPWQQVVISLTSIPGNVIRIRFTGVRGTSFTSDMAIDNVAVIDCTPTTSTISAVSCGYWEAPSGKQLHSAGTYLDTIANSVGCDSIITINLTTNNTTSNININNICGNYTMPSGLVVGQDGAYTDTSLNAAGCDSVIFYNLTFDNTFSFITRSACDVYTAPSGAEYTLSGIYSDTIANAAGCDSVITIDLDMFFSSSLTKFVTTCGEPFTTDQGNVHTTTGIYLEFDVSQNGCDSLIYYDLVVAEGNTTDVSVGACDSFISPSGMVYNSSGVFTETFTGVTGCDSIINYDVTISTANNTASFVSAMTAEATENAATAIYQWVDCNNGNAIITGADDRVFTASVNGDYACRVSLNECVVFTNCIRLGSLGVDEEGSAAFTVYPNPSNGAFTVELPIVEVNTVVTVSNAIGQTVYTAPINKSINTIDLGSVEAGVYFISVVNDSGIAKKAIVVN